MWSLTRGMISGSIREQSAVYGAGNRTVIPTHVATLVTIEPAREGDRGCSHVHALIAGRCAPAGRIERGRVAGGP
jgi:hypothetical protein